MKPRMVGDTMALIARDYASQPQYEWQERCAVRRNAGFVGFVLLALFSVQLLMSVVFAVLSVLHLLNVGDTYYGFGNTGYVLFTMIWYVLYLPVPVLLVALFSRRWGNPFASKRAPRGAYITAVFGGMALSAFANVMASYIMNFLTCLGVKEPTSPDNIEPTVTSLLINIVATAIFPAIFEEMVFRGYILGALRPHGDKLAVIISALLFGLIHGNILQVPFAAILGMVLGWLVVQTNSIWPAVALHGANNLFSVVMQWLERKFPDNEMMSGAAFFVLVVAGAIVLIALFVNKTAYHRDLLRPMTNGDAYLTVGARVRTILTTPAFLVGGCIWLVALLITMFTK